MSNSSISKRFKPLGFVNKTRASGGPIQFASSQGHRMFDSKIGVSVSGRRQGTLNRVQLQNLIKKNRKDRLLFQNNVKPSKRPVVHDDEDGYIDVTDQESTDIDSQHQEDLDDNTKLMHRAFALFPNHESTERRKRFATSWSAKIDVLARILSSGVRECDCSVLRKRRILCIRLTAAEYEEIDTCQCPLWPANLLVKGLFPSAPKNPSIVFGFDVLELFQSIYSNGPCSKRGFAEGLQQYHENRRRGVLNSFRQPFYNAWAYWVEVQNRSASNFAQWTEDVKGKSITSQTLDDLCPSCYFDDSYSQDSVITEEQRQVPGERIVHIGIDGNFQHRRLRNGNASKQAFEKLAAPLFFNTPGIDFQGNSASNVSDTACKHHFSAPDKPSSLKAYDETGLLGAVCRHGIPIRCANLYQGERYHNVAHLLSCILQEVPGSWKALVTYDIGCHFDSHFRNHYPDLSDRTQFMINAFHVYAHELKCQINYGPRYTLGAGETDGEGIERVWSRLAPLVSSGRVSTATRRNQAISSLLQNIALSMRASLPRLLSTRYNRAVDNLREARTELDGILYYRIQDPENPSISHTITHKLIEEQIDAQKLFFKSSLTRTEPRLEIVRSIIRQLRDERVCAVNCGFPLDTYLSPFTSESAKRQIEADGQNSAMREQVTLLLRSTHDVNNRLQKEGFTREDLKEEGNWWRASQRSDHVLICEAILRERGLRTAVNQPANSRNHQSLVENLEAQQQKTSSLLSQLSVSREVAEVQATQYDRIAKLQPIHDMYLKVLKGSASRLLELRAIHNRIQGQKDAQKLTGTVKKRQPQIMKSLKEFIRLSDQYIQEFPEAANFLPKLSKEVINEITTEGCLSDDVIYGFEYSFWRMDPLTELAPASHLWPFSGKLRHAMTWSLRITRAEEEIALIKTEIKRLVAWSHQRLTSLESLLRHEKAGTYANDLIQEWLRVRAVLAQILYAQPNSDNASSSVFGEFASEIDALKGPIDFVESQFKDTLKGPWHKYIFCNIVAEENTGAGVFTNDDSNLEQVQMDNFSDTEENGELLKELDHLNYLDNLDDEDMLLAEI